MVDYREKTPQRRFEKTSIFDDGYKSETEKKSRRHFDRSLKTSVVFDDQYVSIFFNCFRNRQGNHNSRLKGLRVI
jgi:hypothetical protein